jgi:hypothetical protein
MIMQANAESSRRVKNRNDLDLQVAVNNYEPDYAGGGTYWQTWLLYKQAYVSTGCTTTVYGPEPTPPPAPVDGACPG